MCLFWIEGPLNLKGQLTGGKCGLKWDKRPQWVPQGSLLAPIYDLKNQLGTGFPHAWSPGLKSKKLERATQWHLLIQDRHGKPQSTEQHPQGVS